MGSKMGCVGQEGKRLSREQLLLLLGQRTKFSFKQLFTGQLSRLFLLVAVFFFSSSCWKNNVCLILAVNNK